MMVFPALTRSLARASHSPQAVLRPRSWSATHQTRHDGTPGGKKHEERLTDSKQPRRISEEKEQWSM